MYMSFEFNCRTNDNVELVLEGSFFWEVVDLKAMVKFTNDTTGDICNHARSRFIEQVSKVTLQEFMTQFNTIAKEVHEHDETNFYGQRGVKIHSLEVTGYHCAENSTAQILEQIIQETTNRMNRLQQQESENEVQLQQIRGDIEEEKARGELLKIQTANSNARSKMEGMAEAERVKSFLADLSKDLPDIDMKTRIGLWSILRKEDALKAVAKGNTKLYFTPREANLSIENHDHIHESSSSWVDGTEST
uniref:Band 7 domain-containing protein n=2 Tax=Odontella aurita TaxID=265563 RepID=A0A7S4KCJ8_9STRA|mmetsp:Transcript_8794/g.26323  ORF Transcript_8794/g.26323 Transcript_8794/m.26323 type:complete len:248 (+) Transcript_8794:1072-1815(+)